MSWLLRHNWLWSLLAFLIGAVITWLLLERRTDPLPRRPGREDRAEQKQEVLVGAETPTRNPSYEAAARNPPYALNELTLRPKYELNLRARSG